MPLGLKLLDFTLQFILLQKFRTFEYQEGKQNKKHESQVSMTRREERNKTAGRCIHNYSRKCKIRNHKGTTLEM